MKPPAFDEGRPGSFRSALAREIAARTPPRSIGKKKREWRPILGPKEMRNVEKERERLLRLLDDD